MTLTLRIRYMDSQPSRDIFHDAIRRFLAAAEADDAMEQSGMVGYGEPIEIHWDVTDPEPAE